MKRFAIGMIALALMFGISTTSAVAQPYISGNLGAVFVSDSNLAEPGATGEASFDVGFGVTGAIGNTFGEGFRGEVELSYRANDIDEITIDGLGTFGVDGDITTVALMGNIYYHLVTGGALSPFVGAGIGLANVEADLDFVGSEDDTVLAYQFAVGGAIAASKNLSVDLQYRFFGTSDPDFAGTEAEYTTHGLMAGLRYSF